MLRTLLGTWHVHTTQICPLLLVTLIGPYIQKASAIFWFINIYSSYIFGLCPQFLADRSQNCWNFPNVKRDEGVFCYVNELWTPTKVGVLVAGEPTLWWETWNFQSPPNSSGRGERRGWRLIQLMANDLVDPYCVTKKPQRTRFLGLPGWWIHTDAEIVVHLKWSWKLSAPFPRLCLMYLFIWLWILILYHRI